MQDSHPLSLTADRPETSPATTPSLFTILPYIMLPMAMAAADQTILSTALADIAGTLGGVDHISWIIVANLVTGVAAAAVYGQLRDVFGSRRMMVIALVVYMSASLFCAVVPTFGLLVFGRALQGLGGGGLMTLSQAIIGETIPPRERAKYQGYLAAVVVTASVAGPIIGGFMTGHFGWRSVFLFNVPLGAVALVVTLRGPTRQPVPRAWSFDYAGLVLFAGCIGPFLLALDTAKALDVRALPVIAALLVVAGAALAGLIWQERRAFYPILPVSLLRQRQIWMSDAMAACHGAALVSLATLLPLYLHVVRGATASETGLLLLPLMLGIGTGSMLTGRMVSRTGYTAIFPSIGLTLATLLFAYFAFAIGGWSSRQLVVALLCCGLSMGTVMSVVQVTVQSAAGSRSIGSAAASVQISRAIGAALGATLTTAVLFVVLHFGDPQAAAAFSAVFKPLHAGRVALPPGIAAGIGQAFRAAFLAVAAFAALGALIAWNHPRRRL